MSWVRILFIYWANLVFLTNIGAQEISSKLRTIIDSKKHLEVAEPPYFIRSIYKDRKGFLWMGMLNSLVKFDGTQSQEFYYHPTDNPDFLLTGPDIIEEDHIGNLWLGSWESGLCLYNRSEGQFKSLKAEKGSTKGVWETAITDVHISPDSTVWIGTRTGGLYKYLEVTQSFERYEFKPTSEAEVLNFANVEFGKIVENPSHTDELWIASPQGLILFSKSKKDFKFIALPETVENYYEVWPPSIFIDKSNRIYLGLFNGQGIRIYDANAGRWVQQITIEQEQGLRLGRTRMIDLKPFHDSLLLAASWFNHFYLINTNNPSDYSILPYSEKQNCLGFYVDHEDNVYVGLHDGLYFFDSKINPFKEFEFKIYPSSDGKSNFQRAFYHDQNEKRYYIGTAGGDGVLSYNYDLSDLRIYRYRSKYGRSNFDVEVHDFFRYNDTLFAISSEGIMWIDKAKMRMSKVSATNIIPQINKVFPSEDGRWFTLKRGGFIQSKLDSMVYLSHQNIHKLIEWKSELLFLGSDEGFRVFSLKESFQDSFLSEETKRVLMEYPVEDFEQEVDTFWIGSQGNGLVKLYLNESGVFEHRQYLSQRGRGANIVNRVLVAKDGRIWMATDYGFSCFDRATSSTRDYGLNDGVIFTPRSGIFEQLENGVIISSARNGFEYFDPAEILQKARKIEPYIKDVFANGIAIPFIKRQKEIVLEPGDDHLSFELAAINYNSNPTNFFWYRLRGYDDKWIFNGNRSMVQYTNLGHGKYSFEFTASPNANFDDSIIVGIPVKIKAKFQETSLYKVIVGCISGILSFALIFMYIDRKRKQRLVLEKDLQLVEVEKKKLEAEMTSIRSRMNPHFIFNSLNSIKWYILKNESTLASKYLSKFSKLMRYILDFSKQEYISLDEEFQWLELYIELEQMRFSEPFQFHVDVDKEIDTKRTFIPSLLIQPFVENAIWHGLSKKEGEKFLDINLRLASEVLCIEIVDNGTGRQINMEKNHSHVSRGFELTARRIKPYQPMDTDGIRIIDLVDKEENPIGTKVIMQIDLRKVRSEAI